MKLVCFRHPNAKGFVKKESVFVFDLANFLEIESFSCIAEIVGVYIVYWSLQEKKFFLFIKFSSSPYNFLDIAFTKIWDFGITSLDY